MIFNKLTNHDIKKIREALDRIKSTRSIVNEETCYREFVRMELESELNDIIYYANEMKKDIKR